MLAATAAFRRGPSSRLAGPMAPDAHSRPAATASSGLTSAGASAIPSVSSGDHYTGGVYAVCIPPENSLFSQVSVASRSADPRESYTRISTHGDDLEPRESDDQVPTGGPEAAGSGQAESTTGGSSRSGSRERRRPVAASAGEARPGHSLRANCLTSAREAVNLPSGAYRSGSAILSNTFASSGASDRSSQLRPR